MCRNIHSPWGNDGTWRSPGAEEEKQPKEDPKKKKTTALMTKIHMPYKKPTVPVEILGEADNKLLSTRSKAELWPLNQFPSRAQSWSVDLYIYAVNPIDSETCGREAKGDSNQSAILDDTTLLAARKRRMDGTQNSLEDKVFNFTFIVA